MLRQTIFWNLFNRRVKKMPDKIMSILAEATAANVQIKKFLMYCHIIALHDILRKEIPKEVYVGVGEPKC